MHILRQPIYSLHVSLTERALPDILGGTWDRTGPVVLFLVFTSRNHLRIFYSASPLPLKHRLPGDERVRCYLIQALCTYVCFTSKDG